MQRLSRLQLGFVSLILLGATVSCGEEDSAPAQGTEGGSCYGNGTCDDGLACYSDKCVDPDGNEPSTPSAGFDIGACFECGEDSCAAEAEKCDGEGACGTLLGCALDCAGDASCATDCATTTSVTAEEQSAMVAYQSCLVTKCLDACTPEVNVPTPSNPTPPTPGQPTPGQPGPSELAACLDCGESSCAAEANACDDSSACGELLSCALDCGMDATCASDCATGITLTADDQTAMVAYQSCLVTQCLDECSFEVNVTPGTPPVTPGTPPTPPTPGSPTASAEACGVVKPPETCVQAEAFVLAEDGTDLVGVTVPTFNELVIADGSVTGDWVLESGQLGVLQFEFSSPIDPARVALEGSLSEVEFVTLEDAGGSGCQYYLSGGRLQRYIKSTGSSIDWYGCWGDYETYETSEPSTLTIINIRTAVSQLNEAHAITVTSMLL